MFGGGGSDVLCSGADADILTGDLGPDRSYKLTDATGDDFVLGSCRGTGVGTSRDMNFNLTGGADDIDLSRINVSPGAADRGPFGFYGKIVRAFSIWCSSVPAVSSCVRT